jgi:hypothetical protein
MNLERISYWLLFTHTGRRYCYGASIKTGNQEGAGTPDTGAYIILIGSKGHSDKINLQSLLTILFGRSLDKGTYRNVVIESSGDLGEVLVVILGIEEDKLINNSLADPWYINDVNIYNYQNGQEEVFPCYHWLNSGDSVSFTAHTSKLNSDLREPLFFDCMQFIIAGKNFAVSKFHRRPARSLIIADVRDHVLYNYAYFVGLIFADSAKNMKIRPP